MDAKDRLRRYLEQRRDAGESELVLDSMDVDDVLRLLGAANARAGTPARAASPNPDEVSPRASAQEPVVPPPSQSDAPAEGARREPPDDWRAALRALAPGSQIASGGNPSGATGPRPAPPREAVPPRSDAERAPAPAPPPATPANAPGDDTASGGGTPDDGSPLERLAAASDAGTRDTSHATMPIEYVPAGIVVGSPAHELFGGPRSPYDTLDDVAAATRVCHLCALHQTAKQAVPGQGNPHADFVCVGEAPGATEDEQGVPFVGAAGQLLTKILGAIQLSREDVFICNVLKHRPPGNRNPTPDEVAACSPYLVRQIELLAPKVIVAFGTFAAQTLLQTKEPIGRLRGKIHRYYGVPLIVTYHPAALLRNPSWKRPTWEDVQLARRLFDRARGT
ncbi:MAG: uracil-DNA glycosylase family protein [Gemmatimonadota bacterium]